jgi:S-adenosylmethionine:tRNA ribosyltransferase-isomerase
MKLPMNLNNTRVLPARILGRKPTGGKVDCLVIPLSNGNRAETDALLRGRGFKEGSVILFTSPSGTVFKAVVQRYIDGARFRLLWEPPLDLGQIGELPLPPYIKKTLADPERYQTAFACKSGSLAAPTAGLHFSQELLSKLKQRGVEIVFVTLHVGIGTFQPIRAEHVEDWQLHSEYFTVPEETQEKLIEALKNKKRVWAVGTTTVRTIESAFNGEKFAKIEGDTNIFIYPGYAFKFPFAGLITNFHLPESSLLLLVSAWAGREKILAAYQEAIAQKYRFYSLGDAMWIKFPPIRQVS